jgi:hypothetical protein
MVVGMRTDSVTFRRAVSEDLEMIVALLADDPIGRIRVKSLPTATPISLPITTPVRGLDLAYPCSA